MSLTGKPASATEPLRVSAASGFGLMSRVKSCCRLRRRFHRPGKPRRDFKGSPPGGLKHPF